MSYNLKDYFNRKYFDRFGMDEFVLYDHSNQKSALVVTGMFGMGGTSQNRMVEDLVEMGYNVDVVPYWAYTNGQGREYDVVLGHSAGGARIQADPLLKDEQIYTFQAPYQIRGTHSSTHRDWLNVIRDPKGKISQGGHSYVSGQFESVYTDSEGEFDSNPANDPEVNRFS